MISSTHMRYQLIVIISWTEFTIPFCISNFNPSQFVKFESDVSYTLEIFEVLTNCDHFLEFAPFCISNFNPSQFVKIEPD